MTKFPQDEPLALRHCDECHKLIFVTDDYFEVELKHWVPEPQRIDDKGSKHFALSTEENRAFSYHMDCVGDWVKQIYKKCIDCGTQLTLDEERFMLNQRLKEPLCHKDWKRRRDADMI